MKLAELQIRQSGLPLRPDQIHGPVSRPQQGSGNETQNVEMNFNAILTQKIADQSQLKFSAHALRRMQARSMNPSMHELERLNTGVERAREKGAQSSLILVDDMAYVVSVKNQTVITALDKSAAQGNVFSNIDSVAIA